MVMVEDIRLQHFRSYVDESFELEPGVNIVVGPNTAGKTNLLEAIQIICQGGSYRASDAGLIQKNQSWSRLDSHTSHGLRVVKLNVLESTGRVQKTFTVSGKNTKHLSHDKTIPAVLFEPNHLLLLTGPKEFRRNFIDDLLGQSESAFPLIRRQYKRTLAQRNTLLKKGFSQTGQLFAWNVRLSELGGEIASHRIRLIESLNKNLPDLYSELAGTKNNVTIQYDSACSIDSYGSSLLKKLEMSEKLDLQRGFTAYGPHRDDFIVKLNQNPVTNMASRGENRTLLLSLKLMELQIIEKARAKKPILLLDDVFSELDGARRRALTEFLKDHQTFITTTDADIVVQHFIGKANIIPISPVPSS